MPTAVGFGVRHENISWLPSEGFNFLQDLPAVDQLFTPAAFQKGNEHILCIVSVWHVLVAGATEELFNTVRGIQSALVNNPGVSEEWEEFLAYMPDTDD